MADDTTRYVEITVRDETDQGAVETVYYAPIDLVRAKFDGFLTSLEREIAGASREVQFFYGMLTPLMIPLYGLLERMVPKMGFPPLPKRERGQDPFFVLMRYVSDLVAEGVYRMLWTIHADADGVIYEVSQKPQPCEDCPSTVEANPAESLESGTAHLN